MLVFWSNYCIQLHALVVLFFTVLSHSWTTHQPSSCEPFTLLPFTRRGLWVRKWLLVTSDNAIRCSRSDLLLWILHSSPDHEDNMWSRSCWPGDQLLNCVACPFFFSSHLTTVCCLMKQKHFQNKKVKTFATFCLRSYSQYTLDLLLLFSWWLTGKFPTN